ncbi:MAG: hypothetical protein ABSA23_07050 [Anaerolineales bacterium]|jgi:hypothetical protein
MKPIARIMSSRMLAIMFASLLLSCAMLTGTSPTGVGTLVSNAQATAGPVTKMTRQMDNKDLVVALIPANDGQIHHSFLTS